MYRLSWDSYDKKSVPAVVPNFDEKAEELKPSSNSSVNRCDRSKLPLVVILHCFYLECLPLIGEYLSRVSDYDLLINLVCSEAMLEAKEWASSLPPNRSNRKRDVTIRIVENCGRDVKEFWNPLLDLAEKYSFFLKVHTKQSVHSKRFIPFGHSRGSLWLTDILESLIPENGQTELILDVLRQEKIGAVFPFPWRRLRYAGWSCTANLFQAQKLMNLLRIPPSCLFFPLQYPIGNMFWGSTVLLKRWSNIIYHSCEWPQEPIGPDGTLLHAIERSIGFLYNSIGLQVAYSKSIAGKIHILRWASSQPIRTVFPSPRYCDSDIEVIPEDKCFPGIFLLANENYGLLRCMQRFSLPKSTALLGLSYMIILTRKVCGRLLRLF